VGGDWFSENVTLANRVSEKRPWNIKSPSVAGWGNAKKGQKEIKKKEKEKSTGEKETIEKREHKRDNEHGRTITFPENRSPPTQFPIQLGPDRLSRNVGN